MLQIPRQNHQNSHIVNFITFTNWHSTLVIHKEVQCELIRAGKHSKPWRIQFPNCVSPSMLIINSNKDQHTKTKNLKTFQSKTNKPQKPPTWKMQNRYLNFKKKEKKKLRSSNTSQTKQKCKPHKHTKRKIPKMN